MGPNGAGKSTLLKLLTDRLKPVSGTRTIHPTADVAYFAQHHAAEMNLTQTPMEYMVSQFPEIPNSGLLRKHLGKVGILGTKADTRMTSLSGGQRSCVVFARITYYCPHLLILDEPTNFLDLDSVDSLITATSKYKGALLIVSHSRAFLNKCARAFLSVVPGRFEMFNDLKSCEKATYTFIQELESGTSAGKLGAAALRKKEAAVAGPSDGSVTISISSVPRTVAKAVVEVKEVKEVKAAPSRNGGGQNSLGHCPKWVKTGECALAERCRFMHDPSKVPGAAPAPAPVDQKAGGRGGPKPQRGGGRGGQRGGQSQRGGGQQRGGRGGARR
jgi:ATP-binding cassette subfamily F protein 3